MSISSSDSKVETVTGAALSGLAVGGAVLAAAAIAGGLRWLSSAGQRALAEATVRTDGLRADEIKSVKALRADLRLLMQNPLSDLPVASLSELESSKVRALGRLSSVPFFVSDGTTLEKSISLLGAARTPREVLSVENAVLNLLETGHNQILSQTVSSACGRASARIGFTDVQTDTGADGTIRVIGVDKAGRALITEISTDPDHNITIAAEVVGVQDGSCGALMDAFDEALSSEGVRRSAGQRKFTGGVCELAASKKFIRNKVRPKVRSLIQRATTAAPEEAIRRTRKLNTRSLNKQK
jgi:hypothetical protein